MIEITFGNESNFQKSLNDLPISLKKITLSVYYTGSIDNLPNNIETLIFCTFIDFIDFSVPSSSCLKNKINKLPQKLKHLYIKSKTECKKVRFNDLNNLNLFLFLLNQKLKIKKSRFVTDVNEYLKSLTIEEKLFKIY